MKQKWYLQTWLSLYYLRLHGFCMGIPFYIGIILIVLQGKKKTSY